MDYHRYISALHADGLGEPQKNNEISYELGVSVMLEGYPEPKKDW